MLILGVGYQYWLYTTKLTDTTRYLNTYEEKLVSRIASYSEKSIKEKKNLEVHLIDLTKGKSFDRVGIIGCYDIDWNKRFKLNKKLSMQVDKKVGIPNDFFMTLLLINKDEVVVLKLNRRIGDFKDVRQSCNNYKNCTLEFIPKEESWNNQKYMHQYITIIEKN